MSNKNKVIWIDVNGYPNYIMSNKGCVINLKTDHTMTHQLRAGYYAVSLIENYKRKHFTIHRLLALHFIPNPKNLPFVDHIDNNPHNNDLSNLRWVSPSENTQYYYDNFNKKPAHIIKQYELDGTFIKKMEFHVQYFEEKSNI